MQMRTKSYCVCVELRKEEDSVSWDRSNPWKCLVAWKMNKIERKISYIFYFIERSSFGVFFCVWCGVADFLVSFLYTTFRVTHVKQKMCATNE